MSMSDIKYVISHVIFLFSTQGATDPVDSSSCQSVTSSISSCSDDRPTGGDANKFNFAFWKCSTPTVSSVSVNNGTTQTTITISGEGFSSTDCHNEVKFGDFDCDITSSSDTELSCTFAKSGEPELGILYQLALRVGNRGNALIALTSPESYSFGLLPNIESITPTSGSMAGGARVIIAGFGFGDDPLVYFGSSLCTIIESSYTEIICESPSSTQGERDIKLQAVLNGNPLTSAV